MENKTNLSTKAGIFILVCAFIIVIVDMILSVNLNYTFDLQALHILYGAGSGVALIVLPEDMIVKFISKWIDKK